MDEDVADRRRLMWLPLVIVLVAVACLGSAGYALFRLGRSDRVPSAAEPTGRAAIEFSPAASSSASTSSSASATGDASASDYPVAKAEDLTRVCDRWYYPQSPKVAGPAPHPISVVVKSRFDLPSRLNKSFYDYPTFDLKDPTVAQLVACVDLVQAGKDVRSCPFNDPKPDSLPLKEGVYQLTLYEVATRRVILRKTVIGADGCPYVVLIGSDRTLFTDVTERQLYETLRQYVEK